MGKSPKGPGDRKSSSAKAGKRHGTITYPAPISKERQVAKDKGEQQFYSGRQLTVQRDKTIIVFDNKTKQFVYKDVKSTVSADFTWDANRGRVIQGPKSKENK